MSNLIVIRIIPETPVDPGKFEGYLTASGGLQITAFDLSFNSPTSGQLIGSASYVAPTAAASPATPQPTPVTLVPPQYPAHTASGIIQQYDLMPSPAQLESVFFQVESVATAIIEVNAPAKLENLRLTVQWGSGAGARSIPSTNDYYDVTLVPGAAPDPNSWSPVASSSPQADLWGSLPQTLYLQLPAPPAANAITFSLPADGSAPGFDGLLTAVEQVLSADPGITLTTTGNTTPAGENVLSFTSSTTAIEVGMMVTDQSGAIPLGTTVSAVISPTSIKLSQSLKAQLNGDSVINFLPDIGALSLPQCQNIASEIIWSQQPSLPAVPDPSDRPLEELYTNPPNTGVLLSSSGSNTTANQYEGDRQEFEASLKSYYATANTTAIRLASYVYALSAAVACEEESLAASQVLLSFPVTPGSPNPAPVTDAEVILTGFQPATNFGVPAAYFYALTAALPASSGVDQRYQKVTGDMLQLGLSQLTAAINAGTITDSESFVTSEAAAISAAQAARRMAVLNVPGGSSTSLAPLGAIELQTGSETAAAQAKLIFSSTTGVKIGMSVSGPAVPTGSTVAAVDPNVSVTLSQIVSAKVVTGATITFAPGFSADLSNLVKDWLLFSAPVSGTVSSQAYQAGNDDTEFWPDAAAAHSSAFLNLVLAALTQGYIIPEGTFDSLGDVITSQLLTPLAAPQPPTVATLDSVSAAQWTDFFKTPPATPDWLPTSNEPGDLDARIAAFIAYVQRFLAIRDRSPNSPFTISTDGNTGQGNADLHFALVSGVSPGMAVSYSGGSLGTVANVNATTKVVTLSEGVSQTIGAGTLITFTPNLHATTSASLPPGLPPAIDWIKTCLGYYGTSFTFGTGFDLAKLKAAAAQTFQNEDHAAQDWLVDALLAVDNLYQIVKSVAVPSGVTSAQSYQFSLVEALYARGFTSAAEITGLSGSDFQQALTGTIAYDLATVIYSAATAIAPPQPSQVGTNTGFHPVNPDGAITNCIPPECVSPLGRVAYLSELLQVCETSTCEHPLAPSVTLLTSQDTPSGNLLTFESIAGVNAGMFVSGSNIPGNTTVAALAGNSVTLSQPVLADIPINTSVGFTGTRILEDVVVQRRGFVGALAATTANCETPLPLIDIVNECLEYMGSLSSPTNGTVYSTSADALAGHKLCRDGCCDGNDHEPGSHCHKPAELFGAMPEYSTPATPVQADAQVEPAVFNKLKIDFSACCLPYSQALDVGRSYLHHFGSSRYEEMRTFRRCITEFVLDPMNEPVGFEDQLWRYPVRIDTAIEYLRISPEEFARLFGGNWPKPCGGGNGVPPGGDGRQPALPWELYGFSAASVGGGNMTWLETVVQLPEFLQRTCLTYCEFLELWESGFVQFSNGAGESRERERAVGFPECEPCCLEKLWLQFPEEPGSEIALYQLAVFIRLWRKLKELCRAGYSFNQLRDICDVLHLFNGNVINPDFIRQLAAFQIFRDKFNLPLVESGNKPSPGAIDADRTHLLALWVGTSAAKWQWAVKEMLEGIAHFAQHHHRCERRPPEFIKYLGQHLDLLSQFAGFNPVAPVPPIDDRWQAAPAHTLRFADVLAKIYASNFHLGEIFYLFTSGKLVEGERPFPLQEEDDAIESPLSLPDDEHEYSLWKLRHKLLEVQLSEEEVCHWSWHKIEESLRQDFGYTADDLLGFGRHFFPGILQSVGYLVDPQHRRYSASLDPAQTTPGMWSAPPGGPFQYDPVAKALWVQLPLSDKEIIEQLERLQQLNPQEQQAVQDLYFQPRKTLAPFAFLFTDFAEAQDHLIGEREEHERWNYFKRQFVLCHTRCRIMAEHLARHVEFATDQDCSDPDARSEVRRTDSRAAFRVLQSLLADENRAVTDWEADAGKEPKVTWAPQPDGGAFAALLGLTGTGLLREFAPDGGAIAWRDVSGPLWSFGGEPNRENSPVPSVLPSLDYKLPTPSSTVSVRNGLAADTSTGAWLGGAEGFSVKWTGALLIDHEGRYEFHAGAPTPECQEPDGEAAEHREWRVTLKRGQKTWLLLNHNWPGEIGSPVQCLRLRRGAYEITVDFKQPSPDFTNQKPHRQHTGFQVKYSGPDTHDHLVQIPHDRLFRTLKQLKPADRDRDNTAPAWQDLGAGLTGLAPSAADFLNGYYTSSLRDIRRTYQRAFKALLFVHRFRLSAERLEDRESELGYFLDHPDSFAGLSYYRVDPVPAPPTPAFMQHAADFDFNFLPLVDDYYPPLPGEDSRVQPLSKRTQAMFDWWERIFDYDRVRKEVHSRCDSHLWLLFEQAAQEQPANPGSLLHHLGADPRHWPIDLHYYQDQYSPVYPVTWSDLTDERWVIRAWHADRWLFRLQRSFTVQDITKVRPDLWASDDPSAPIPGEASLTGNANLFEVLSNGCIENGYPRRYNELEDLNNGLRERGRNALVAYLCRMNRVALPWLPGKFAACPGDLSALLLLDVETGIHERSSRIDEAITAVQQFVRRARLQLEPAWKVSREFARLWDRQFASFEVWQACKRRHLYKENFVEWDEMGKARRGEAFRFLESELRSSVLSVGVPGGLDWWPDERPPAHGSLEPLQSSEPAELKLLTKPREGLNLLGTPEYAAQPSWLTAVLSTTETISDNSRQSPATDSTQSLPFWMKTAIRFGTRFYRVAAAAVPPASMGFAPHKKDEKGCVECCEECGCKHNALVDEYYFWLVKDEEYDPPAPPTGVTQTAPDDYSHGYQDDYYDPNEQVSTFWQDPDQLPQLLEWQPSAVVRLAWCRMHNGKFEQPRRSVRGVAVQSISGADLIFQGRTAEALTFSVTNPITNSPVPGHTDQSAPGFRYELTTDQAVVLPLVTALPSVPSFPGALPAYPWFAYYPPGSRLFPSSLYSPSLAVASALRAHCRFEPALRWYRLAFDPLIEDCTWVRCPEVSTKPPTQAGANGSNPAVATPAIVVSGNGRDKPSTCCDSTDVSCPVARNRSVLLHYLETLRDWGKAVMRRTTPEAFQHARLIFDTAGSILGKRPADILLPEPATRQQVFGFRPYFAPLNPRLLDLYDVSRDHLDLIHASVNSRRLRNGKRDLEFFGDNPLREGWRTGIDTCAEESDWCHLEMPYRFLFRIQKALEYAGKVRELGAALLSAFEKGDAEYLAALRAGQEREILVLGLEARKDQWRDADWQVEALQKTKAVSQANLAYYNFLIQQGLVNGEIEYQEFESAAISLRGSANNEEAIAQGLQLIPDFVVGGAGFGGSPVAINWLPLGTKLGGVFQAIARITNNSAEISSMTASLDLTEAGWQRRLDEWIHQTQILAIEIEQAELQILGAQRRRDQALQDLNSHQRQLENSTEIQDFLRDKFTAHELYLFLQAETTSLFYRMYELALQTAQQAERAFNFERGHTTKRFLPEYALGGTLREKLLAGEHLELALHRMEKAYLDLNIREYELTKHISLRLQFPMQYLQLRTTGFCEVEMPEWMFDLDYPGMYLRRIKNITLTVPCVTGVFTGVHCRLTLLNSMTRIDPRLDPPPHLCCHDRRRLNDYEACFDDPRVVRQYAAREAIATSSGQNDSGMFELNFRDERYLPFEYLGTVCRLRIELPPKNNYFELDTLSDLIVNLNYTAREGGELLRRAASEAAERRLPGDGWCFFDVRHEFPDAWQMFRDSRRENGCSRKLPVRFSRAIFPFIPGHREVWITELALIFETYEAGNASHVIGFEGDGEGNGRGLDERARTSGNEQERHKGICCSRSDDWPGLYHGVNKTTIGPLGHDERRHQVMFSFDNAIGDISRIFLLCRYVVSDESHQPEERQEIGWLEHQRREGRGPSQTHQPAGNGAPVLSRR